MGSPGWLVLRGVFRGLQMAGSFGLFGTVFLAATLLYRERLAGLKIIAWVSVGLALLAAFLWFILQTADFASDYSFSGIVAAAPIVAEDTRFGVLLLGRCAALVLAVLAFQAGWPRVAAIPAAAAIAAESWLGHGGAMPGLVGNALLVISIAHLLSGAAWLGGLPALRHALGCLPPGAAQPLARRFSQIGTICVAVILATAAAQYVLLIGRPWALVTTAYGLAASAKILLLAGLILLAAFNRLRFTPGLPVTRRQLICSINAEIVLSLLILLAAGLILQFEPPAMKF